MPNDASQDVCRLQVRLRGRVQGVGFRYHAQKVARDLGLSGWVRNEIDGSVTLVAEGNRSCLEELLAWCRCGPVPARVDDVQARWAAAHGDLGEGFPITG